jgi:hypothetical protein
MKAQMFGHTPSRSAESQPIQLSEVSFVAVPDVLRGIARFLEKCARELENDEAAFEHAHFADLDPAAADLDIDVIVANPRIYLKR